MTTIEEDDQQAAARRYLIDSSLYPYAQEYAKVDGNDFSFQDHNYLVELYQDEHPYIVIEKSAQMGASVYAMLKSFFVCDKLGKTTIYFFPTDTDVKDFSKTRVTPILEDSVYLRSITTDDTLGLRRVGRGWLYFRGMISQIAMKSIPADFLVFDELDEVTEAAEDLADQRLNHSKLKWRLKLSTPTFEGFGIDREFKRTDQRFWNLVCRACQTFNVLEDEFPNCIRRIDDLKCVLVCKKCGGQLDPQYGVWVPKAPNINRFRGYHLCGLYSAFIDLSELMYDYEEGRKRAELYRSKLGIPYTDDEQRVTLKQVYACVDSYEMHVDTHCYMGVDQKGDGLHITIRKPNKITRKSEIIEIAQVKTFDLLDTYMRRYDVDNCVIDGTPNQHSARDFAARFPGRVYLCYYSENQRGDYLWHEPGPDGDRDDWSVVVDRTEALDAMYEQIQRREVSLPIQTQIVTQFANQLTALARVNEINEDGSIKRAMWKRLGEDHYAHSASYSLIAQSRYGNNQPRAIMIQSPQMARIIKPRTRPGDHRF